MSARRGVGLSAFQNRSSLSSSYASHGASLQSSQVSSLQTQLAVFQSLLHNFALQHADTIKSNATFRAEFARMCNAIGVDPLAASNVKGKAGSKSWWGNITGSGVNDFYFTIAVRIVEVCRASRAEDGGLLAVDECRARVSKGKGLGGEIDISNDDILRAVKALTPLGSGFSIISVGTRQMIRSTPKALNMDQTVVLEAIQALGHVTCSMLEDNLDWKAERAQTVIDDLLGDGIVWVDDQASEKEFWSPAWMNSLDE